MITIIAARHSGMDCPNPGSMEGFELASHGTEYPLTGGYGEPLYNFDKVELTSSERPEK